MKPGFHSPLVVRNDSTNNGARFVLVEDLVYMSRHAGLLIVKRGTETDFASIPRFLWRILPPAGSAYDAPAVIHDKLYREQNVDGVPISRSFADRVFGEAMTAKRVPRWKRWTILAGLKLGGFVVWNNYTRAKEKSLT